MSAKFKILSAALALFASATAVAAPPSTVAIEGRLTSQAGGPVADGAYAVTFSLYGSESAKQATWTEKATLTVKSGRFNHALGAVTALNVAKLDKASASWLGIQIGGDPELPRVTVASVMFALRAGLADSAASAQTAATAADVKCSGCVGVAEMKFDGDVDLGGNSLKAKNGTFTGGLAAASVTAAAFVGDGSKLSGVKVSGGACKAGEVVTAVKPDGSVVCAKGGGGGDVLGGKVSDTFTEVAKTSALPVNIPDNTGAVASVQASYGKVGSANSLAVKVALTNTDLSQVRIKLFPPDDKKTGLTLCDPCGAKDAKALTKTYTEASALKSGSLKDLIGKSLEGIWTLQALDSAFCLPQLPGNDKLCDPKAKLDGQVTAFEVSAEVTSAASVKLAGSLQLAMLSAPPFVCDGAHKAHVYFDTKANKLRFCDGKVWRSLSDTCGNGIMETGEQCDDGNNTDGDGCSSTCETTCGDKLVVGKEECDDGNKIETDSCTNQCKFSTFVGKSCLDILNIRTKASLPSENGSYWVDVDGPGGADAFEVYCDMKTAGGGWTKVSEYAETYYSNLAQRSTIPYQAVLILEYDHAKSPAALKTTVTNQTCYNTPKKGFQTQQMSGPNCDTGIQVRVGGKNGSCGDGENGCFGVYKGKTTFGSGLGCNWNCSSGAVTIWGKGYNCNSCRCRNTPQTTIQGCGNGGSWGSLRHWILVR